MAVKLSEKRGQSKTVTVDWDGDDVEVSYFPNAVTPKLLEDVDEAAKKDDLSVLGVMLEPILVWWDVLQDDGSRYPTDAEHIAKLPMRWINRVQTALQEDQNPPESQAKGA